MRLRVSSRAQIFQEFQRRCQSLAAKDNSGFKQEFEELSDVGKEYTTRAGEVEANREKNRYPFILPYDHCRVRLSLQDCRLHSDYINASFVPGGGSERDFICTQGPLRGTMADFWRMVWEQNVRVIVMVTALRQKDMVLCDQYWPLERGTAYFGSIQVTTVGRRQGPDYFITSVLLRHRSHPTERIVTHYYYPTWPDHGVPKDAPTLCAFTEHVRQHLGSQPRLGPTVVHCSAGVGRSGTFVALIWLLQLCARGIQPDVRAAVEDLRRHRVMMIQNTEQYIFLHQCLLHWLSIGTTAPRKSIQQSVGVPLQGERSQDRPHSSSGRPAHGDRARRGRRTQEQQAAHTVPTPTQAQSAIQQLLDPLRRLLPSSSNVDRRPHR